LADTQISLTGKTVSSVTGFHPTPKQTSQASLNSFETKQTAIFHENPEDNTLVAWFKPFNPYTDDQNRLTGGFKILDCEEVHINDVSEDAIRLKGDRCNLSLKNHNETVSVEISINRRALKDKW
jgi:hypothetical protein